MNSIIKSIVSASAVMLCACPAATSQSIRVNPSKVEGEITPYLYGSCMEDVNHEVYGGLYDQKIFGEGFEEPAAANSIIDFSAYDGDWLMKTKNLFVGKSSGAKLVYDMSEMEDGWAETELKFENSGDSNAGLLLRVSDPGRGPDSFDGYEVSLVANGKSVVLGKHVHNWQLLEQAEVDCNPKEWNKLRAVIKGGTIEILLNGKSVLTYRDPDPLGKGKTALRTFNSDVYFRNLKISTGGKTESVALKSDSPSRVSHQWEAFQSPDAKAVYIHDDTDVFGGDFSQIVQFVSGSGVVGINNMSLNRWGIAFDKGQIFRGLLYLKGKTQGPVTVALQSEDGTVEYARQEIPAVTGAWAKYEFALIPNATDGKARFAIYLTEPGEISIDQVMLFGDRHFRGLPYRDDIGTAMVDEGLTFLRYGGFMVNSPEYRFKKMIGPRDKRPPYKGSFYTYSSNGFGIEDLILFAKAAGFEYTFAVNIEEDPQDIADMVEYLNGPITSEWGKKRAEYGHPEPFNVKYIEIGNEEVIGGDHYEGYKHYVERFLLLHDAIKSKDPSIELINSAWWRADQPENMEMVFRALNGKSKYWDLHTWADNLTNGAETTAELKSMKDLFLRCDPNTDMKCAILEENGGLHDIQRALGHVLGANAVRRAGDFVLTTCAANALQPYKQNDNGWDQGQIFFTPTQVWGMPPFYATQMSAANHRSLNIAVTTDTKLDITATRDEAGDDIVLHVVNIEGKPVSASIEIDGFKKAKLKSITLAGDLKDRNSPEEPDKVVPKERITYKPGDTYEFPAYSYVILVYSE